jgi:hypothetical protein
MNSQLRVQINLQIHLGGPLSINALFCPFLIKTTCLFLKKALFCPLIAAVQKPSIGLKPSCLHVLKRTYLLPSCLQRRFFGVGRVPKKVTIWEKAPFCPVFLPIYSHHERRKRTTFCLTHRHIGHIVFFLFFFVNKNLCVLCTYVFQKKSMCFPPKGPLSIIDPKASKTTNKHQ